MPGTGGEPGTANQEPGAAAFVEIETTRPELIPACVALVAHPDDERYKPLFGSDVTTPLFGARVPVRAHPLADPEKGSGIAMICTFGDITDVTWWRELQLPVRAIVRPNGTLGPVRWGAEGWESVVGDYALEGHRSVADVVDAESLQKVRDFKKAQKAGKAQKAQKAAARATE